MARVSLPLAPSRSRRAINEHAPAVPGDYEVGPLVDARGRPLAYLRLSITDRCDMACVYCMPPGGEDEHGARSELLAFDELVRVARVFVGSGVSRVRLTGGEPLVRKDVVRLVEMIARDAGAREIVMTTNASRLAELAAPLARAGLAGVNVSVDSLDAARFGAVTRGGELSAVMAGIHAALDAGLEVKTNTVALGGVNDHELAAIVDWAWSLGIVPRFIELMPLGEATSLPRERFLSADAITSLLAERVAPARAKSDRSDRGPARYLAARDGSARRVGLITAMSDEFCDGCNRVRMTAQGELRACLASRRALSLRDLVRAGASDRELAWAIAWSLGAKGAGHDFLDAQVDEHAHVGMSLIGG